MLFSLICAFNDDIVSYNLLNRSGIIRITIIAYGFATSVARHTSEYTHVY